MIVSLSSTQYVSDVYFKSNSVCKVGGKCDKTQCMIRQRRFKTDPPQMWVERRATENTTNDELMKYTCPLLSNQAEKQTPITTHLRMIENVSKENDLMNSQSLIYSDRFKRKHRKTSNRL
ncbi:hypothetical protein CBL_10513 [Carabus blaptoides fortunei]